MSRRRPSPALEAYALKAHHYGRLSGVSLAAHAIRDAFLLLHTGVGCKYKAAAQISIHDWARQPHRREGWTEVGDGALIRGAAARIAPYVRSWVDRQQPGLVLVSPASHLEMTGEDLPAAVAEAGATVPCPVRLVPGTGFEGDLYDGYAAVIRAVLGLVPFADTQPEPGHVSVVGYVFDRYEADHTANLHQLATLLGELGLTLDAVLLSGQPLERLQRAARSSLLIALPGAHRLGDKDTGGGDALSATGRDIVRTGLPLGLSGTTAWLRAVARAARVPAARVDRVTARLEGYARRELTPLRDRALGRRTALFAETPAAVGFASLLDDLGMPPLLVGLRDRSFGGTPALHEGLAELDAPLRPDAEVLEDPSLWTVRAVLSDLAQDRRIHAVLGSAAELHTLQDGPGFESLPTHGPTPGAGSRPGYGNVARLTVGFPATGHHVIHPLPTLGYGGAVALGQRLLDALFGGQVG